MAELHLPILGYKGLDLLPVEQTVLKNMNLIFRQLVLC